MNERDLFMAALPIGNAAERAAYLDGACAGNPALRQRIEALLAAFAQAGSFLQQPAGDARVTADLSPPGSSSDSGAAEGPGTVIGPYKLIEQIGEGGMGTVWMAQQTEPVKRLVAVKLIKAGMDSRQVIVRFEAERQALALMDHAHIARVLDAGTTSAGRPYVVMDLVKGVPITRYCDEHHLPLRQRLELFVPVCQAVQHAHQKGIIHRDLKPSNVLVALYDGQPVPKVIDFGVAKAAGPVLTDKTLVTGFGNIVGTLEYMSPEQAEFNQLDIDTRSDIYALGVLLYELLTGSTPFSRKELDKGGVLEMLRVIREQEPTKPSTKLSTADGLATLAAHRRTEPAKLTRLVRGELDWIVMKALEKDRARRYQTANSFVMDVQRYLADEPVLACPPSTAYRFKKFVRRNRGPVLAAGLVFLALVVGVVGTTWGLLRAEEEREDAVKARLAETERAEEAQKRLTQIEKGTEILASVFRDVDPKTEAKEGVTLRVLLGRRLAEAAQQLEGEAVGDPLIVARLQHLLGISLRELSHQGPAEAVLVKARQTRGRLLGADHLETASTKHHLAGVYRDLAKYDLAEQLYNEVIAVRSAQLGPDHTETLSSKNNLALVYMHKRRLDLAEPLLKELLAIRTAKLGPDDPKTLQSKHNLIGLYGQQKKWEKAEPLLEQVVERRMATLGPKHPDTIQSRANLATLYSHRGKYAESEALFKEVLAVSSAELGPGHVTTLTAKNNLGGLYLDQGNYASAETLLKEVLDAQKGKSAPDHPDLLRHKYNLGMVYWQMKKFDQSIPLLEEVFRHERTKYRPDDPRLLETQAHLGRNYQDVRRFADAIPLLEEVRRRGAPVSVAWVGRWLLTAYVQAGKETEAASLAAALVQEARKKFPADSPALGAALTEVGMGFLTGKAYANAEPVLREGYSLGEQNAPDAWATHHSRAALGGALLGQRKYAEAEPHLVAGYREMKKFENDPGRKSSRRTDEMYRTEALERLVQLYEATNKPDEAANWRKQLGARKEAAEKVGLPNAK
jgi:serine/threonine protein kinase/tetratricopeptide (TPR) repeat protein